LINLALTQEQIENIQIDYGIVYANYGETDEAQLGPTRGGGEFAATATIRDIEFDGSKGKTKGMQTVDDIKAQLNVTQLNTSMDTLKMALPFAKYDEVTGKLSVGKDSIGIIPNEAYLKNITMFAKTVKGEYKKITLYNAMSENGLTLAAAPKAEGTIALNVFAHWDEVDDTKDLFDVEDVEDVESIEADTTVPTVTTDPEDAETDVAVSSSLTATFDEDIRQGDIKADNFTLIKASDGTEVTGALTYSATNKTATFDPTESLAESTDYIWIITNVRDLAGNKMAKKVVNFKTT
jgi:hypothetical protein